MINIKGHGLGPVWITQNATVQYYGEHVSGALSSIAFWFPANFAIGAGQEAGAVGPAMTAFGGIPAAPPPFIPVDLNAPDPLEAWTLVWGSRC